MILNIGHKSVNHDFGTGFYISIHTPVWSYWSPIRCLPGWQIGECAPDMDGTGEIKYPGQTKTSTAALRLTEGSVKARGRKPRKQITWSSRLGVMRRASYPSMENFFKLKILNKGIEQDGLMDVDESECKGMSNKLHMGTWNMKTLLKPGKMQELVEELAKTQLGIVATQETRWPGTGHIKKKDFSIYYSVTRDQIGQAGTGFILLGRTGENVIGFEAVNERLCKIRLKSKYNNLTLINIYAPTEDKVDVEKEKFYDDLQTVQDRTPKSDTVIVFGDANAKLGKEDAYNEVSRKHNLHELSNRNGEMLLEFALGNNLKVMSTQFQHKKIHKGTWLAPERTLNQ